jgi:hypothetical protein
MGDRKQRLAVLLTAVVGALGIVGVTPGTAQATVPLTGLAGIFANKASCDASQASSRATPNSVVAECSYYPAADPSVHIPAPGWYYRYALPGDDACGTGCHTPLPPPPYPVPVTDCAHMDCHPY